MIPQNKMEEQIMSMTMNYEFISPEMAKAMLERNDGNRRLSRGTVQAYAKDILDNNWDESVGTSISIDENGILRDGQHRLAAIVMANVGIHSWVCRNVSSNGVYDNNRKRSTTDQIAILRPDLDKVYRSTRYISTVKVIIGYNSNAGMRTVSPKEVIEFTDEHKDTLDGFFLQMPQATISKISISPVFVSLLCAFVAGVPIDTIKEFYNVLCTGMSVRPEEFPIIAYRNYLKDQQKMWPTLSEIGRCQYALKKYMSGSCTKRTVVPKELIWPMPFREDE